MQHATRDHTRAPTSTAQEEENHCYKASRQTTDLEKTGKTNVTTMQIHYLRHFWEMSVSDTSFPLQAKGTGWLLTKQTTGQKQDPALLSAESYALTKKLLVEEEGARAIPVLIHQLQELSEDGGHMGSSGRDRGTMVS